MAGLFSFYFKKAALLAVLLTIAAFSMGLESCNKPNEYCKNGYTPRNNPLSYQRDRQSCTEYCSRTFSSRENLIKACQHGQFLFLSGGQESAERAVLDCERQSEDFAAKVRENAKDIAAACKVGVTEEELRTSRMRRSNGQARDRETGNAR